MLIDEYRGRLPIKTMCELTEVSQSAYYDFKKGSFCKEDKVGADENFKSDIEKITLEFAGYGYRRVTHHLERQGQCINHKRVLRVMQEANLTVKKKKYYHLTTDSNHSFKVHPNFAKGLVLTSINELWIADITYIRLRYGFCYLAAILDSFSRKVIGFCVSDDLSSELSLSALRMALVTREIKPGLIHHSDRGAQYASTGYINLLKEHGILVSMSAKGNPYDNAKAESFMATLKKEEVHLSEYDTLTEARISVNRFIEDVYNQKRLHSSLGYLPPAEFEGNLKNKSKLVIVS